MEMCSGGIFIYLFQPKNLMCIITKRLALYADLATWIWEMEYGHLLSIAAKVGNLAPRSGSIFVRARLDPADFVLTVTSCTGIAVSYAKFFQWLCRLETS